MDFEHFYVFPHPKAGLVYLENIGEQIGQEFMPPELHLPRKKHFRKPLQLSGSQSNNINNEYGTLFAVRILREKLLLGDMLIFRGLN